MGNTESFIFGKEISPQWFLNKVNTKDIEYIFTGKKVIACRLYDVRNIERTFYVGDIITSDLLYRKNGGIKNEKII